MSTKKMMKKAVLPQMACNFFGDEVLPETEQCANALTKRQKARNPDGARFKTGETQSPNTLTRRNNKGRCGEELRL